jgi:hypothetical protein
LRDAWRVPLRLGFLAVFLAGLGLFVMVFVPGPGTVAEVMGESCSHDGGRSSDQCGILDVALISFGAAPMVMLVGLVGMLLLRRPGKGPLTLDFSRR